MRFANELVDVDDFAFPTSDDVRPQELKMAEQLVENLLQPFDPSKYVDDYHANLMKIIRAKMKGKEIEVPEPEERESTPVVDLMARLKESLEMGKQHARAPRHGHGAHAHRDANAHARSARRAELRMKSITPMLATIGRELPDGRRLGVRAEVRRHSHSRVRGSRARRAHQSQRHRQGATISGSRRRGAPRCARA